MGIRLSKVKQLAFFPTTLCGVLVFDSLSRVASPPPPPASSSTHSHTQLCHVPSLTHTNLTDNFVTQLCHIPSLTHTNLTHNTTLSHTIFHTQLSHTTLSTTIFHTPSFTHNFVTHHLSHTLFHTLLSHTIFNTPSVTSLLLSDHVGPSTNSRQQIHLSSRRVTQVELAFALRNLSPHHPMMFAVWVAPACFIFRHVFCFASFLLLACLRMSCYGMVYGRSGMLSFPTCFLLRLVCSTGLFTHVMFRHVLWSLRHVLFSDMFSASLRLFCWLVCARPVPAFFMVAPACGIYRYVFCMCIFRHVSSFCVFRHV